MRSRPASTSAGSLAVLLMALLAPTSVRSEQLCAVVNASGETVITNSPPDGMCRRPVLGEAPRDASAETRPRVPTSLDRTVARHARRYGVSPRLVHAVIQAESAGNPYAVSPKGARGIMQLMPATARRFDVDDPLDPDQNIEGGVRYLSHLLDLYGGDTVRALAAYNAGEEAVRRYGGVPPYKETRTYVRKVLDLSGGGGGRVRRRDGSPAPSSDVRMVRGSDGVVRLEN